MTRVILLNAALMLVPLLRGQNLDKPSPVPEKSRRTASTARAAAKSALGNPSPADDARAKARKISGAQPAVAAGDMRIETGKACFFTARTDGNLTASGERANSSELVAGHATYPLGSSVLVTNMANGKSVEVRIVDRFPKGSGRVINLSESAARQLDFIKAGTIEVSLQPVRE